jgi:antitoxin PrlF
MTYALGMLQTLIQTPNPSRSRLTAQGQVSVPAAVRRQLGLTPGSVLEWVDEGGRISVQRATRHSNADVHQALFPEVSSAAGKAAPVQPALVKPAPVKAKTLAELKRGIAQHMQTKYSAKPKAVAK